MSRKLAKANNKWFSHDSWHVSYNYTLSSITCSMVYGYIYSMDMLHTLLDTHDMVYQAKHAQRILFPVPEALTDDMM